MFVVLYIARWIFGGIVAFKLILGCHVHLLALLILCWDTLQVIRWRCDVLSMAMRITYDFSGVSDDDQRAPRETEDDESLVVWNIPPARSR